MYVEFLNCELWIVLFVSFYVIESKYTRRVGTVNCEVNRERLLCISVVVLLFVIRELW
jgi:hypothetical protein